MPPRQPLIRSPTPENDEEEELLTRLQTVRARKVEKARLEREEKERQERERKEAEREAQERREAERRRKEQEARRMDEARQRKLRANATPEKPVKCKGGNNERVTTGSEQVSGSPIASVSKLTGDTGRRTDHSVLRLGGTASDRPKGQEEGRGRALQALRHPRPPLRAPNRSQKHGVRRVCQRAYLVLPGDSEAQARTGGVTAWEREEETALPRGGTPGPSWGVVAALRTVRRGPPRLYA